MTEVGSAQPVGQTPRSETRSRVGSRTGSGVALQSELGTTTIEDSVVAKITGLAAREVAGVADLGGTAAAALGGVMGRLRGDEHSTAGVGVEVGERQAAVDISMKVEYPARIHEVADSVRGNVIDRLQTLTGLEVVEVNIAVVDLVFPGAEGAEEARPEPAAGREQRVE